MSDKTSSSSSSGGIGFVGLLTIVFITLKLLGKIDWSWWWVLSPLWISPLIVITVILLALLGVGAVAGIVGGGAYLIEKRDQRKLRKLRERRMINVTPQRAERKDTHVH